MFYILFVLFLSIPVINFGMEYSVAKYLDSGPMEAVIEGNAAGAKKEKFSYQKELLLLTKHKEKEVNAICLTCAKAIMKLKWPKTNDQIFRNFNVLKLQQKNDSTYVAKFYTVAHLDEYAKNILIKFDNIQDGFCDDLVVKKIAKIQYDEQAKKPSYKYIKFKFKNTKTKQKIVYCMATNAPTICYEPINWNGPMRRITFHFPELDDSAYEKA